MAPPRRVDEAIAYLEPWIGGRIGQDVAGSESAERGVAWTISWPPDAADATVFRGMADLVAKDRQGDLQVILFSNAVRRSPGNASGCCSRHAPPSRSASAEFEGAGGSDSAPAAA